MSAQTIMVVEDDAVVLKALEFSLQSEGFRIIGVRDSTAAMDALRQEIPDLMILDVTLIMDSGFSGISDGFSFLGWMRYTMGNQKFPVIIHTADKSRSVDKHAHEHDVFAVIRKGGPFTEILDTVRAALAANPKQ
jgi:DNA-binding response OmpR family regulator